ncbi:MAG: GNAT family N-acetyltransferase [Firmicutes bacterium]|nr:GNAT family N-acetyltransferase [Bacillota bacterium]
MKILETERLILRKFSADDFTAVHSFASCPENVLYMRGPNTENETMEFIDSSIKLAEEVPCKTYRYAVVLKESGALIGYCGLKKIGDDLAEISWILHLDYWNLGYGTEMGKRVLELGFDELNIRRIISSTDAENAASCRLMEKLGMRREGLYFDAHPAKKQAERRYTDEAFFAILKSEWEVEKEIAYYNSLPFEFNDFVSIPTLSNGSIYLVCIEKSPANPEKNWVPAYTFAICKNNEKIGETGLRIGYGGGPKNDNLYYGGQVGYNVNEEHRGNSYAVEACKLLLPIAKAHKMTKLLITNNYTNIPSRRVCEKLGTRHVGKMVRLPEWSDLYKEGQRFINIYEWDVN